MSPINSLKEGERVCITSHLFQLCARVISFELRGKAARDLSVLLHTGIVRGKDKKHGTISPQILSFFPVLSQELYKSLALEMQLQ